MTDGTSAGNPAEDRLANALRGFGPIGILAVLIILGGNLLLEPLSAVLVLIWVKISDTPWRDIGYARPRNWPKLIAIGIAFGVTLKFAMKAIVMPLLGAPPVNSAFHFVTGNPSVIPFMLYLMIVVAGFGEETLFRGWMFERLGKLFGQRAPARIAIVLITASLFAAVHYPLQRIPGVQQAFIVAVIFGSIFVVTRQLFMLMIAHAAFDLAALAMIYWDWERLVAHLIFK